MQEKNVMNTSQVRIGVRVKCKYSGNTSYFYNRTGTINKIISDLYCQYRVFIIWDDNNINMTSIGYWSIKYFEFLNEDKDLVCKKNVNKK